MTEALAEAPELWVSTSGRRKQVAQKAGSYFQKPHPCRIHSYRTENRARTIRLPKHQQFYSAAAVKLLVLRRSDTGVIGVSPAYVATVEKLIELLHLPDRWNSYNAKPIKRENVTIAVGLLGRVMGGTTPPPSVVPKVRGGVQLEWHRKGINVEVSIDSPAEPTVFAEEIHTGKAIERKLNERVLRKWINRISD